MRRSLNRKIENGLDNERVPYLRCHPPEAAFSPTELALANDLELLASLRDPLSPEANLLKPTQNLIRKEMVQATFSPISPQ